MIKKGEFREDLFYRLNVLPIQLPPLRERKNDIEVLSRYFIDKFNQQHRKNITGLSPEAMELIKAHAWPGNIRELENVIEHAFVIETSNELTPSSLPESIAGSRLPSIALRRAAELGSMDDESEEMEDLSPDDGMAAAISIKTDSKGFKLDINRLDFQANKEEFERQF
ncbi:MAG: AAA-type ATPase lid domain-containing protein, partial [Bdellovibrionota bacterium]